MKLDNVYAVIAYYLQNRTDVDAYLHQVVADEYQIREKIESAQPDLQDLRERLLKRAEEKLHV